jgi:hypothetical protein
VSGCADSPAQSGDAQPATRRFVLIRDSDISGVSGTGLVADGVVFPDGVTVLRWRSKWASTVIWPSVSAAMEVHGHGGATRIRWLDQ